MGMAKIPTLKHTLRGRNTFLQKVFESVQPVQLEHHLTFFRTQFRWSRVVSEGIFHHLGFKQSFYFQTHVMCSTTIGPKPQEFIIFCWLPPVGAYKAGMCIWMGWSTQFCGVPKNRSAFLHLTTFSRSWIIESWLRSNNRVTFSHQRRGMSGGYRRLALDSLSVRCCSSSIIVVVVITMDGNTVYLGKL